MYNRGYIHCGNGMLTLLLWGTVSSEQAREKIIMNMSELCEWPNVLEKPEPFSVAEMIWSCQVWHVVNPWSARWSHLEFPCFYIQTCTSPHVCLWMCISYWDPNMHRAPYYHSNINNSSEWHHTWLQACVREESEHLNNIVESSHSSSERPSFCTCFICVEIKIQWWS